ncbi:MAG TPA: DUF6505 family protein [Xanthobacteraceae bacterium]|nr:DUF6505 family protein [Xanthobacteraceae bacterium]
MKLLRTIQLDPSDTFVFERAAEPGEWAVSGAFSFWNTDAEALEGKARAAFRSGFLGVQSLGRSTLAQIVDADEKDKGEAVGMLAHQLMQRFGAPDIAAARKAAEDEIAFAQSLCTHPANTLIAVRRIFEDGQIRETFRSLKPREGPRLSKVFSFVAVEGEDEPHTEQLDLLTLAEKQK